MAKTATKQEKAEKAALRRLPAKLGPLGFEAALLVNYGVYPSRERLTELFKKYQQVSRTK